jgi:beta-phosphoglucomutase family hydrolase
VGHIRPATRGLGPLGLPPGVRACLFDLDGVLTDTAHLHAAAWKEVLDEYLGKRALERAEPFAPFDATADYSAFVDGKKSEDGVRAFLDSRGIKLPEGQPSDSSAAESVAALSNRKNGRVLERFRRGGVKPFADAVCYVNDALRHGLRCGVVSSSSNCRTVLAGAGIAQLFEVVIDAPTASRGQLAGKPAPDMYLAGARALGVPPCETAVFEDAPAGVSAGRSGRFGYVVGVDRAGGATAQVAAVLLAAGADVVISDLAELIDRAPTATPLARRRVRQAAR